MIAPAGSELGAGRQLAAAPWDGSRRLWSLWDLMQQFDASKFVEISNYLAQLHQMMDRNRWVGFLLSDYDSLIRDVTIIRDQLRDMGLDAAEISAGKLLDVLSKPEAKDTNIVRFTVWDSNQIKAFGEEITARARGQLQARLFLFIPNDVKELYVQSAPLFGQSVSDKFQSLEYEIAEIGKCLALGRSTASAFHSIRCLEAGIKALSRCLGIPNPTKGSDRNWGKMLGAIKGEIDRRWPTTAHRMSGDGQFFENNYAALAAMRNPWRNPTMHIEQIYTEQDAKDLFAMVGSFMRGLASRMDENGDPLA